MNLPTKIVSVIVGVLVCVGFTEIVLSPDEAPQKTTVKEQPKPLVNVASHTTNLATFVTAVKTADLTKKLNSEGPFTIFAPDDSAFAVLPKDTFVSLMDPDHKSELKNLLMNHIVKGKFKTSDLKDGQVLTTLSGKEITISIKDDTIKVDDAGLERKDIHGENGTIQVINKVLMPTGKQG